MTRLIWDSVGNRKFEVGVDRGVLYCKNEPGVSWNGLISVRESPAGGVVTPYFIDGVKYLNHVSYSEFRASLEAFTYPDEFAMCDGTLALGNGLFATMQPKRTFGLSYRTKIGNDLEGSEYAYKLHLVYGATATSTERSNDTIGETLVPSNFSWEIFTKPPAFVGYRPTSHFIVDSRTTPTDLLVKIEDILYGSEGLEPRLPSVPELIFMFEEHQSSTFDAGFLTETYFTTFDSGHISEPQSSTIDGGSP